MTSFHLTRARPGACASVPAVSLIVVDVICVFPFSGVAVPEDLYLSSAKAEALRGLPGRLSPSAELVAVFSSYVSSFRGRCSCAGFLSSCLLSAGYFADEENLGLYREDETHLAARSPSTCAQERTLDGRGGDLPPVCEGALADLDGNAYHLGALLSLADSHAASHSGTRSGVGSSGTTTSR